MNRSAKLSSTRPFTGQLLLPAVAARHSCRARVRMTPRAAATLPSEAEVVVVGAGLAGLNAAVTLQKKGLRPIVIEASDAVGGRTRTDNVEGFLLDRGFQIFLTGRGRAQQSSSLFNSMLHLLMLYSKLSGPQSTWADFQ